MKGWVAAGAAVAVGTGVALRRAVKQLPEPFEASPRSAEPMRPQPMPELPDPVRRYLETVAPELPVMTSAVITGRLTMRLGVVAIPGRWRFTHEVGTGYRHDFELTLYGRRVATGTETFIDGHARLDLPTGLVANEPRIDSSSAQSLWGEFVWLPSVLADGQWEPIDAQSARLLVPGAAPMVAWFDEQTGLLSRFETVRWRDAGDPEPLPWVTRNVAWSRVEGIGIPAVSVVQWSDQKQPWLKLSLDDVAWNVPVDLRAGQPMSAEA